MLIKNLREKNGMSKEEFAYEVGSSFSSVNKWEREEKEVSDLTIGRAFRDNMLRLADK